MRYGTGAQPFAERSCFASSGRLEETHLYLRMAEIFGESLGSGAKVRHQRMSAEIGLAVTVAGLFIALT